MQNIQHRWTDAIYFASQGYKQMKNKIWINSFYNPVLMRHWNGRRSTRGFCKILKWLRDHYEVVVLTAWTSATKLTLYVFVLNYYILFHTTPQKELLWHSVKKNTHIEEMIGWRRLRQAWYSVVSQSLILWWWYCPDMWTIELYLVCYQLLRWVDELLCNDKIHGSVALTFMSIFSYNCASS